MNHNNNRSKMQDARKNKKKKKKATTGKSKIEEGGKLKRLLNELNEDTEARSRANKLSPSAQRAEDILQLIRSRQQMEGLSNGIDRIIRQQAKTAANQFLRLFFSNITGTK